MAGDASLPIFTTTTYLVALWDGAGIDGTSPRTRARTDTQVPEMPRGKIHFPAGASRVAVHTVRRSGTLTSPG